MLDIEARHDIETIKRAALQIWGHNCQFGDINVMNSPYPEFELQMRLYQKVDVGIYYDRSALDIGIKQDGKYVLLAKFTTEQVFRGMKAMKPENLRHDFEILNKVARELIVDNQ